jgi:hypothetical protein
MTDHACPEDGCDFAAASPAGLGAHRSYKHGTAGASKATRAYHRNGRPRRKAKPRPTLSRLHAALTFLAPGADLAMLRRLARFARDHDPAQDLWLVATAEAGPWLCRATQVGMVASRERTAVIAVQVRDIRDHLDQQEATP